MNRFHKRDQEASDTEGQMTDAELSFVLGGGSDWPLSDAATSHHNQLVDQFNNQLKGAVEGAMNFDPGTATRNASDAFNTYQEIRQSEAAIGRAADQDAARLDYQHGIDRQIENGHNQSPADANMSNWDGSPGVADDDDSGA